MGMESFFVEISIDNNDTKDIKSFNVSLVEYLNSLNGMSIKITGRMALINDIVEMETEAKQGFYRLVLIGCFSCFTSACLLMHDLTNILGERYNVLSIKVMGEEIDLSKANLIDAICEGYSDIHQRFLTYLTNETFDASPSTFYKRLRYRRSCIGRFMRWLRLAR